ncbi:MAG: hypothetical protein V1779_02265, partial [bacterium]
MGNLERQNNGRTERRKTGIAESSLIYFALIMVLLLLNITITTIATAQNKKPKLQSLDTLPPKPEWEMCYHGVNVCFKRNVYDKPDDPTVRSNLQSIVLDEEHS